MLHTTTPPAPLPPQPKPVCQPAGYWCLQPLSPQRESARPPPPLQQPPDDNAQ
ncbi:hypothetical protein K440DRAFT_627525 [Wilcoxina mikolae CBS 423.85]|nr:hypothetical protein K440DRAFT_627525 [Wilcoxina mikolae CBS 423.85]